ncbi:MAG: tRNA (N(6)-L-threonylcarbamoyladenosine(37)-C(2))-methylthiotransferase MtaB [Candidatus Eisenbacteria bacterium]|nr:tRNA (N(6)-L-threonylcarbamoyladenosine(37)-C(2))-methylthiotransferase MtaB [Candidatus Eisenbacteria bacterium]
MDRRRRPTVSLTTVGCKLNQYESEGLADGFERAGFRVVPSGDRADVCVVNTCTVTTRSDYRSRQMLRRGARVSDVVVATGCYAEREPGSLARMPEVRLIVGNGSKNRLVELVSELLDGGPVDRIHHEPVSTSCDGYDVSTFRGHTRAFIKIQDGCDHRCSYCAVPDARGPSRSRPTAEILDQVARLAGAGYREVVLTGVHIGCFEDGIEAGSALARLVEQVVDVEGIERVRLGSVEPTELLPDLAELIVREERVCPHLHIPLQSGSDRVLKAMGRRYDSASYIDNVRLVTDELPFCGFGADVMVGFPGETDEDFAETVEVIESLPFTYLHVFSYSPRAGTEAARRSDQVPGVEKRRRSRQLRELSRRRSLSFRRSLIGRKLSVLFEDREGPAPGLATGLSENYVRIDAPGGPELANRLGEVEIIEADGEATRGAVLESTLR